MGISVHEIGQLDPYTYNDLLIRYLKRQAIESGKLVLEKNNSQAEIDDYFNGKI